ncbi:hypothetical protein HAX54_001428 [Datura stramonium]|uniref:Uncharacterized protein n=1 Tax=Datura stramonium TaxID=4076 RepID=A0ABS8WT43_DATST|nr:hypothetical protein [Datura stramonium]
MHSWYLPKDFVAYETDGAPLAQHLNEPTPEMSGHVFEEVLHLMSIKNVMKDVFDNLDKLFSKVDVVKGTIAFLGADMRVMKGMASLSSTDMRFLDKAMATLHTTRGPIDELLGGLEEDEEEEK